MADETTLPIEGELPVCPAPQEAESESLLDKAENVVKSEIHKIGDFLHGVEDTIANVFHLGKKEENGTADATAETPSN